MKFINGFKLACEISKSGAKVFNLKDPDIDYREIGDDQTIFNRVDQYYNIDHYDKSSKKLFLFFMPVFKWEIIFLEKSINDLTKNLKLIHDKIIDMDYDSKKDSLIFVICCESWIQFSKNLYSAFRLLPEFNLENIYLADEMMNDIKFPNHLKHLNHISHSARVKKVNINHDIEKDKLFLSFNRRVKNHRVALVGKIIEENLLDRSFVSFFPTIDGADKNTVLSCSFINDDQRIKYAEWLSKEYRLDDVDIIDGNLTDSSDNLINLYKRSYFSLICETQFEGYEVSVTEKTYKAIVYKHPFIMLANAHFLKYLRKLGYKTFHPFINESYDDIEDHNERFKTIVDEIKRLSNLSNSELKELLNKITPIINYNYEIHNNNFNFNFLDSYVTTLCPVIDTFEVGKVNVDKVNEIIEDCIYPDPDNNVPPNEKIMVSRREGGILKLRVR